MEFVYGSCRQISCNYSVLIRNPLKYNTNYNESLLGQGIKTARLILLIEFPYILILYQLAMSVLTTFPYLTVLLADSASEIACN